MGSISINEYKSIMTDYATAQDQLIGISDKYFEAAYTILRANAFDPEIDLLVAFHNAYIVSQGSYASAPSSAINAVRALQNHILNKAVPVDPDVAKYNDVNEWYADHVADFPTIVPIIPQGFATMSTQAGHVIDTKYIEL